MCNKTTNEISLENNADSVSAKPGEDSGNCASCFDDERAGEDVCEEEASLVEVEGDTGDDDLTYAEEAEEVEEAEEILPVEFLEDPETFSSVLPRDDEDDEGLLSNETVIMSPSEVRRLANRSTDKNGSSRRSDGSSIAASRRSRRSVADEENLSPEEIARRRRNDMKAKFFIYATIVFLGIAFLGLLTYKLPGLMGGTFPDGIWPWNKMLERYTGNPFNLLGFLD